MAPLSRAFPLALTLALGLGLSSCAVLPSLHLESPVQRPIGTASILLLPRVKEGTLTQALVARPTAARIHRLDVIPMVETAPGQFQPFTADGTPTALGDAQAVSLSRSGEQLTLTRSLLLERLAAHTRYRILARAYDADGKLISKDADSTVDVSVTDNDAPTSAAIPVVLADVPFAARTTVTLSNATSANYTSVVTSLVTVAGGTETLVPSTTQTLTKAQMPMVLTLDGLLADTTYRLKASMRDASNVEVATAAVEIAVSNDDAPAAKTLTLETAASEPSGVTTLAGGGPSSPGFQDGTGTAAMFNGPSGLTVAPSGELYVADYENHAIRKLSKVGADWVVTTLAGGGPSNPGFVDGTGTAAKFFTPSDLAIDGAGNLYVADTTNYSIRKISKVGADWVVTTLAGGGNSNPGFQDGTGTNARFQNPSSIAVDHAGNLYVADSDNHAIRKITPVGGDWVVSTLAGGSEGFSDGTGAAASFNYPSGIAVDAAGNVYVGDYYNHAIRKITPAGEVSTLAGAGPAHAGYLDGTGSGGWFNSPNGVTVDSSGNVYVTDSGNHAIRKVTPLGVVTTLGGSYPVEASGFEDGPPLSARFNLPLGIAVDAAGRLLIAESGNHSIRQLVP